MEITTLKSNIPFLNGGGEMGELIRTYNWAATSLGAPETWPMSLCTTVSNLLRSKFPMLLWWGEELIQFYNDAYRASLGNEGKHPRALGQKCSECWMELWPQISKIIQSVQQTGEGTWVEDKLIPMMRDGKPEDVYWTYSYSAVLNDEGLHGGVLTTCLETTQKVRTLQELQENEDQLSFAIEATELGTWDYNPKNNSFTGNDRLKEWFGLPPHRAIELKEAIDAIADKDRRRVAQAIKLALQYSSGGYYEVEFTVVNRLNGSERIVRAKGRSWFGEDKVAYRFNGTLLDVTEQVIARQQLEESEAKYRTLFERMDQGFCIIEMIFDNEEQPADYRFLEVNAVFEKHNGLKNAVGRTARELVPNLEKHWFELYGKVAVTGEPVHFAEESVALGRWFDVSAFPVGSGAIRKLAILFTDVTERKRNEEAIKESAQDLRSIVLQAPIGVCVVEASSLISEIANGYFVDIVGKPYEAIVGKYYWDTFAEARMIYEAALDKVIREGSIYRADEVEVMLIRHGKEEKVNLTIVYEPMKNSEGVVKKVAIWVLDNTAKVIARRKVEESEQSFRNLVMKAPVGICIVNSNPVKVEIANDTYLEVVGKQREAFNELPYWQVLEEAEAYYAPILENVFATGDTYYGEEHEVLLLRRGKLERVYITFVYDPLKEQDGSIKRVLILALDVTAQVVSRMKVEQSNEELQFLIDVMPQMVWVTRPDGYHSLYNKQWYDYTGLSFEQSKDVGWNTIVHQDDQQKTAEVWSNSLKTGQPYEIEYRLKGSDNKYRWFLGRALPLKDESGNCLKWFGTCTDIDDQKRLSNVMEEMVQARTQELESQKTLLNNILTNSSNGISVTQMLRNEKGEIYDALTILANDAAVRYVGLPKEVFLSKTAVELDPNIVESTYGQTCIRTLETGQPSLIQYYLEVTGRWLELTLSKMDDDHLIHIFTDVTAAKEAQLHLERTIEELKRSNTNLEDFAYAASHDLKEPLRKIRTFSDKIKNTVSGLLSEGDQYYFQRMEKATERMQFLIDDLLEYSHVSGSANYMEDIDLSKKLRQVLEDLEVQVAEKDAKITADPLPVIKGHRRQLQQLFQNLITNALKFSKAGVPPEIRISASVISGEEINAFTEHEGAKNKLYHLIEVSDNGIGFEQEYEHKIFKMFQRLHGKTDYEGTGIGLAIVRKVVENHKGFIKAESKPGEGATFKILLPIE